MTYQKATEYLFQKRNMGMKLGLENIQNLLKRLGHPERTFPSIHIAGTNGKGSTAAILESILREARYKTGLYTSPHLIDMRERMKIRGKSITQREVVEYTKRLMPHVEATGASFFETLTAMAFLYFSEHNIDIAVLETGLGGRLDATNVVNPLITIITEIGLEHTRILGNRLDAITKEKAGILKSGVPCVLGAKNKKVKKILSELTSEQNIPLTFSQDSIRIHRIHLTENGTWFDAETEQSLYKNLYLKLLGQHQIENAALALLSVEELRKKGWKISQGAVYKGLDKTIWRARLELLQEEPKILLDSAHNPIGMQKLTDSLKQFFQYERLILVFGVLRDKNYQSMAKKIVPMTDHVILSRPLSDRALEPDRLMRLSLFKKTKVEAISEIVKAWNRALSLAEKKDLICAAGSIYFVGEVLRLWENQRK